VVHLDGAPPAAISLQVSPTGKQRVDAAVRAALQACLSGRVSRGCPPPAPSAQAAVVPGSVRGRLTGNATNGLTIFIAPGTAGLLRISGNVIVNGSFQRLDFDNQPVRKTGIVELAVSAQCYATAPSRLAWGAVS
jgi:hypothetical protein